MSIIRLTLIKDRLYAPRGPGTLEDCDYTSEDEEAYGRLHLDPNQLTQSQSEDPNDRSALSMHLEQMVSRVVAKPFDAAPLAVMVNGFLFDPRQAVTVDPKDTDNPHGRIFHFETSHISEEIRHHTSSWPKGLGFEESDNGRTGLAIAFGWYSQPGFASSLIDHFQNFYSRAYDLAQQASQWFLHVLQCLSHVSDLSNRPIDVFCHSLGSVVVIRALAHAAYRCPLLLKRIGRVILLGGSEYCGEARTMYTLVREEKKLQEWAEEEGPQFYNIVSRENAILDIFAENFGPRSFFSNTQVIGHNGLESTSPAERWLDLQIDRKDLMQWLLERNVHVSGDNPGEPWDHWYYYTHRGNMNFYSRILRNRKEWSIAEIRRLECPEGAEGGAPTK